MFEKTRLTLTTWYLIIIMLVSVSFSIVIREVLMREVDRFARSQRLRLEYRIQHEELIPQEFRLRIPPQVLDPDLIAETRRRVNLMLMGVNVTILFLAGGFGYFLAGRTLRPIREMVDEQNRFISDASHELRTPLTALKSSLEVTRRDKKLTLSEAKGVLGESIEEVNKLQSLSDGLLQIIQYQKPNQKMVFELLSLKEVIRESVRRVQALAKKKNISFKTDIPDYQLKGNSYSLSELFIILLDNAIKYSPENTLISVQAKKTDGSVLITFKDQGIGIAEKDLPHIFDRFYRTDSARSKSDQGGYGLGLAIAKEIVDLHQGLIKVESTVGKGATFTIRFPLSKHSS